MQQQTEVLPRRSVEPLFDGGMALFFLSVWLAPGAFGPADELIRAAMVIMMLEFILIHATGFLGFTAFAPGITREKKLKTMALFSGFYLIFLLGIGSALGAGWPILAFFWLLAGKLRIALRREVPDEFRRKQMVSDWTRSLYCYIGCAFVSVLGPVVPRLGISPELQPEFGEDTSGIWIDYPHGVVAMGVLYFTIMAIVKLRASGKTRPAGQKA